jgi:hypothetical protein
VFQLFSVSLAPAPPGDDVSGKEQCEKLRQRVMSLENAAKLDELLALTIAR